MWSAPRLRGRLDGQSLNLPLWLSAIGYWLSVMRAAPPLRQCALILPVNKEQALRKQPGAVHLYKRVEVTERGHHQASLSAVHGDMMRQAIDFSGGPVAC